MTTTETPSFARFLIDELTMYARRSGPIQLEGKSERYARAIVSSFNTMNGTSYSVLKHGAKLFIGLRSDCRNAIQQPVEQQPVQPAKALSPAEYLTLAVEGFRHEGLGGDEMRALLNSLLTDNDDLL
jgi:hypothetical protein